jgi:hypothetical protein
LLGRRLNEYQVAARGLDTVVAVFAKRKGSKNSTNLLAGEQGVELSRCAEPTEASIECITLIEPAKLKDV